MIPGGFRVDEQLYYTGDFKQFSSGNRLLYGAKGSVQGRHDSRQSVLVQFHFNKTVVACGPGNLSRSAPVLPGGFRAGEKLYYTGDDISLSSEERLIFGAGGTVLGRGRDDGKVRLEFPGYPNVHDFNPSHLRRSAAAAPPTFASGAPAAAPAADTRPTTGDAVKVLSGEHEGATAGSPRMTTTPHRTRCVSTTALSRVGWRRMPSRR